MMENSLSARFNDFEFESDQGVFHDSGVKINLRPKELAVLEILLRRHGNLVTKEQIIGSVWRNMNTSDESIARCISVIKSSLRKVSPNADQLIKNEYGQGYRFTGAVTFFVKKNLENSGKQKKVGEIASTDILNCNTDSTVLEAAQLLQQHRKSSIIVIENGQAVGIWTEADALALDLADPSIFDLKINSVMHSPIKTIQEWKPLSDAVLMMRCNEIRHLLVIDNSSNPCGIISQTDLVRSHGVESFLTLKNVKSVLYKSPLVITQNEQVSAVVQMMRLKRTEIAIIQLAGQEMFSFTERDLMGLIAKKQLHLFVSDIEHKPLISVNEDMTLLAARQLMEIQHIRHLAVIDNNKELLKILGLSDILQVIEHSYVHLLEEILEQNKQVIMDKDNHIQMLTNAVQQTAGMILISDKDGNLEYVNKAFEHISGYELEEVKGLNPRFLKSGQQSSIQYQTLWKTLLSGKTWKGELCNRSKSGSNYWVLASITPIYNELGELINFVAVEEDITSRIEMETQLRETEQRFHDMADALFVMIWEANPEGKFIYFSGSWREFTGLELNELYGNAWAKLIHPDDLIAFLDNFQQSIVSRKSFSVDFRLKNATQEYRWVMNTGKPRFSNSGAYLGFMGYCIDLTGRKVKELGFED